MRQHKKEQQKLAYEYDDDVNSSKDDNNIDEESKNLMQFFSP